MQYRVLTERDLAILDLLQDGPLSSYQLWKFTEHIKVNHLFLIKRLRLLWQEGYIDRPRELNPKDRHCDYKMYELTPLGKKELERRGLLYEYAVPTTGGYPHMVMAASIVNNIKHYCRMSGLRFISQEDILKYAGKRSLVIETTLPKTYIKDGRAKTGRVHVIPDQLFGIDYGGNNCRYFAVEADRGKHTHDTIKEKLKAYRDVGHHKLYKDAYGVLCLFPLFVTTSEDRAQNIIKSAEDVYGKSRVVLATWIDGFLFYDKPPKLFPELWERGYLRAGHEPFFIGKA